MKFTRINFSKLESTHDYAKTQESQLNIKEGILYIANEQTNGRGTHGKKWFSPPGNIYATLAFLLRKNKQNLLPYFPQVTAYSIAQSLIAFGFTPKLRWINDIFLNGKKVGGVLCETNACRDKKDYLAVYISFGINVNVQPEDLENLDQPVTALFIESGKTIAKDAVLEKVMSNLCANVDILIDKNFGCFQGAINNLISFKDEMIYFDTEDSNSKEGIISGKVLGIDKDGKLLLRLPCGEIRVLYKGHILSAKMEI